MVSRSKSTVLVEVLMGLGLLEVDPYVCRDRARLGAYKSEYLFKGNNSIFQCASLL